MRLVSDCIHSRQNNFDFIRFIASASVIFSHAFSLSNGTAEREPLNTLTDGQATFGTLAVWIFFVLSGFLITQSYDKSRNLLHFGISRVLRVYPALFLVFFMTVFFLGPLVTTLPLIDYFSHPQTYDYLKGIFLRTMQYDLPGVFQENVYKGTVNGSLWSLYFEFLFYIVVAFLGAFNLLTKRSIAVLFLGSLIVSMFPLLIGREYFILFRYFSAGMFLYAYRDIIRLNKFFAIVSLSLLIISVAVGGFDIAFVIFGSYVIIYFSFSEEFKMYRFAKYGDLSYGLYIFAYPVQQTITMIFGGHMDPQINFIYSFIITSGLAFASWHLVESKSLRIKKRLLSTPKGHIQTSSLIE